MRENRGITLTGFTDEIDASFDVQLKQAKEWGLTHLEIRGVDGKNIAELSRPELEAVRNKLNGAGIFVSAIGSPIGKAALSDPFAPHFVLFQKIVEYAKLLDTKYIRIFSFYLPEGAEPEQCEEEIIARLTRMIAYAKEHNIVLLHENEKQIYGEHAVNCLRLFERLYGDHFKGVFDFANFVECGQDTWEAYEMLKPYIAYVHIKDAVAKEKKIVPAGDGDGRVKEILRCLKEDGYSGFLSLEPHLVEFTGLQELEAEPTERDVHMSAKDAWKYALLSLKSILWDIDWKQGV